jgi:hypothetical protein
MPAAMQANGLAPEDAGEPHRRGRGVLLVVGVQGEDPVHRAAQDRVDLVFLGRTAKHMRRKFDA